MSQKVLSFFLAFALVLSLTRIVFLTDVRAEEIAEARNDVVASPSQAENSLPPIEPAAESPDELHPVDDLTESDSIDRDKWLEIMREQEELMTPEIRASIRENVKAGLKKQLEERFGSVEAALNTTASASELGFASEDELQMWKNSISDILLSTSTSTLTLSHNEYAICVDSIFPIEARGYKDKNTLRWYTNKMEEECIRLVGYSGADANFARVVECFAAGEDVIQVYDTTDRTQYDSCAVEALTFTPNYTSKTIAVGESFTVTATTSYSNSNVAIRALDNIGGMVSFSGATVSGVTPGTAELIVYLVDRPTVCKALTVTVTEAAPTIDFTIPSGDHYAYENITLTPITTPANAEVEWSVAPDGGGVFNGNVFTPYRAGGAVIIYAKIKGTNIKKSRIMYVNKRVITVEPINDRWHKTEVYYIAPNISHGSLSDITYSISNSDVVSASENGVNYFFAKEFGYSTIMFSAPGADSVSIEIAVIPQLFFTSCPDKIYANKLYTYTVFSDAPEVIASVTYDVEHNKRDTELQVQKSGNYHTFSMLSGNANTKMLLYVATTGDEIIEIENEYTLEEPVVIPDVYDIETVSSNSVNLCNETDSVNGQMTVSFRARKLINGIPQTVNRGINYRIHQEGPFHGNCQITGNTLTITTSYVGEIRDANNNNCAAHTTGTIIIEGYLDNDPDICVQFTVNVVCEAWSSPSIGNNATYVAIPHADISGHARTLDFGFAFGSIGMTTNVKNDFLYGEYSWQTQDTLFFDTIRTSKVVTVHSHGEGDSISINANDSSGAGTVYRNMLESLHDGYFGSTNLLILLTCHGGDRYSPFASETSISSCFLSKGVRNVFAFQGSVPSDVAKNFEEVLYNRIYTDTSSSQTSIYNLIKDAVDDSADDVRDYSISALNYPDIRLTYGKENET